MNIKALKNTLAIAGLIIATTTVGFAQKSIQIVSADDYIEQDLIDKVDIQAKALIKNTSAETKNYKVKRVDAASKLPTEHVTYFCWVQCYGPAVDEAPTSLELKAGETTDKFYHDIITDSIPGSGYVTYYFYDVNNPADSTHLTMAYKVYNSITAGISKNTLSALAIYPNPASTSIQISNITETGIVEITDLTGRIIKSIATTANSNLQVDISDIAKGLYLARTRTAKGLSAASKILVN
mgnify:CR=1 FL=1